jgi:hypothetical protein
MHPPTRFHARGMQPPPVAVSLTCVISLSLEDIRFIMPRTGVLRILHLVSPAFLDLDQFNSRRAHAIVALQDVHTRLGRLTVMQNILSALQSTTLPWLPWYESWFDSRLYHTLYARRDAREAGASSIGS